MIIKIQEKESSTIYEVKTKEKLLAITKEKNTFELGDKIEIQGLWEKPSKNTTKSLFNYEEYLKRKNIFYTVQVTKIKRLKKNKNIYYKLKQILINSFHKNPYLHTLILGDKTYLKKEVLRSYQENGISHLFAISGMHITLLSSLLKKGLRKFKTEEDTYKIISVVLIIYLSLVGLSPSILRGVLFYILMEGNKIYYFYIKKENLFLGILSIALLINPYNIYDVGFQYSYLISYALLKKSKSINSENKGWSALKVSWTSFFVSIPITIKNFNQLNLLSILYNLFYVPYISTIFFPFTLIVSILKPLEPVYEILIQILEKSSLFLSKISILKFIWKEVPLPIYILYFILMLIYLNLDDKRIKILIIILLMIHYMIPFVSGKDILKVLDIGQGDSILLLSNHKSVLVDTGGSVSYNSSTDGELFYNIIWPTLKKEGIKKLDYMIITHGDKDHIGEAETILNHIKVKSLILNCNKENFLERNIKSKNKIIGEEGLSFQVGDYSFTQLNECFDDENDSSQIYYVTYKDKSILLTGDASIKSERILLENYELENVDFLKVGHHGSKTSTSTELLETIQPNVALISSGRNNKFHHPDKEVIKRLENFGIKIYNTQTSGTITVNMKTGKITEEG